MDPASDITTVGLPLDDEARDIWDLALASLPRALAGDDSDFLQALETAGRGAGLTQRIAVGELLGAYSRGCEIVRARLLADGVDGAETAARRLLGLERTALTRLAAGYSAGLADTIDRLRRIAEESSPLDVDTGAMRPGELGDRLALEVERCQRMDLSLGLVELAVDRPAEESRQIAGRGRDDLRQIVTCLRDNLRRYDSVGLTHGGAFVLVLPDVSRRGLSGAAERLRRELGACTVRGHRPDLTFALAHYDFVDVNAREMLAHLERGIGAAREARLRLAWA